MSFMRNSLNQAWCDRQILIKNGFDVIVVGGGVAGVSAAVGAAREGVSVLLIEKNVALGGLATIGLINWYEPLCDGNGTKMIGGIPEELIRLSIEYGFDNLPKEWEDGIGRQATHQRYATHFSPTLFAVALDQYVTANNVQIRFDSLATIPVMEQNRCVGVCVESVEGVEFFPACVVVDATGDARLLQRAGMPTELGENYLTYVAHVTDYGLACKFAEDRNMAHFRKWMVAGSDMNGEGHPEGMRKFRGDTGDEVTEFVLRGRKVLFERLKDGDRASRDITMLPGIAQLRTIRRLVGDYTFTGNEQDQKFPDAIGSVGDFRHKGRHYQIPYACLCHSSYPNLLAAGRIISASGDGWEITRVIPVASLTGQAAGVAAGICVKSQKNACAIDIGALQQKLADSGALFV